MSSDFSSNLLLGLTATGFVFGYNIVKNKFFTPKASATPAAAAIATETLNQLIAQTTTIADKDFTSWKEKVHLVTKALDALSKIPDLATVEAANSFALPVLGLDPIKNLAAFAGQTYVVGALLNIGGSSLNSAWQTGGNFTAAIESGKSATSKIITDLTDKTASITGGGLDTAGDLIIKTGANIGGNFAKKLGFEENTFNITIPRNNVGPLEHLIPQASSLIDSVKEAAIENPYVTTVVVLTTTALGVAVYSNETVKEKMQSGAKATANFILRLF